jgi:hypothetical protein
MTGWPRSDDPIPEGHIRLSEAFDAYYRKVTPNSQELENAIRAADARRASAEDAPKISAWKRAADGPLSKTEEDNFLGTLSETERAFWKAEREFYAAVHARELARGRAQIKFRKALSSGELRPMIRDPDTGHHLVLSIQGWDQPQYNPDEQLLGGFDSDFVDDWDKPGSPAVNRDRLRPVFFGDGAFRAWLTKQGVPAANAAPKVGPDGGRPSPDMPPVEAILDRWIDGGTARMKEEIRRWTPKEKRNAFSKARLARALAACRNANGGDITASAILRAASPDKKNEHKSFPGKFKTALDLI